MLYEPSQFVGATIYLLMKRSDLRSGERVESAAKKEIFES
jgi:hypothetical protein